MKSNLPDPQPGTEHLCNGCVDCWDSIPRPCVRPKGHTGGCNPFSDTDHSIDVKPVEVEPKVTTQTIQTTKNPK